MLILRNSEEYFSAEFIDLECEDLGKEKETGAKLKSVEADK
jgi:hypothetical protein